MGVKMEIFSLKMVFRKFGPRNLFPVPPHSAQVSAHASFSPSFPLSFLHVFLPSIFPSFLRRSFCHPIFFPSFLKSSALSNRCWLACATCFLLPKCYRFYLHPPPHHHHCHPHHYRRSVAARSHYPTHLYFTYIQVKYT